MRLKKLKSLEVVFSWDVTCIRISQKYKHLEILETNRQQVQKLLAVFEKESVKQLQIYFFELLVCLYII